MLVNDHRSDHFSELGACRSFPAGFFACANINADQSTAKVAEVGFTNEIGKAFECILHVSCLHFLNDLVFVFDQLFELLLKVEIGLSVDGVIGRDHAA
jgi:hypothetical protein